MTTENLEVLKEYLSEEEIKELVIDEARKLIKKGLTEETLTEKRMANYERVLYNSVHYYLDNEVDSVLGIDHKKMIRDKVVKSLKEKDLTYSIFRAKSAWDTSESPGQIELKKAVAKHTDKIDAKVQEVIANLDMGDMSEYLFEYFNKYVIEKLSK